MAPDVHDTKSKGKSSEAFSRSKTPWIGVSGAGDGNRNHVRGLGSRYSTIEPRPLGPTLPDRSQFRQVCVGTNSLRITQLVIAARNPESALSERGVRGRVSQEIVLRCAASLSQLRQFGGPAWPIRIYGNSSSGWRQQAN